LGVVRKTRLPTRRISFRKPPVLLATHVLDHGVAIANVELPVGKGEGPARHAPNIGRAGILLLQEFPVVDAQHGDVAAERIKLLEDIRFFPRAVAVHRYADVQDGIVRRGAHALKEDPVHALARLPGQPAGETLVEDEARVEFVVGQTVRLTDNRNEVKLPPFRKPPTVSPQPGFSGLDAAGKGDRAPCDVAPVVWRAQLAPSRWAPAPAFRGVHRMAHSFRSSLSRLHCSTLAREWTVRAVPV
jgi:hypothetical protein